MRAYDEDDEGAAKDKANGCTERKSAAIKQSNKNRGLYLLLIYTYVYVMNIYSAAASTEESIWL